MKGNTDSRAQNRCYLNFYSLIYVSGSGCAGLRRCTGFSLAVASRGCSPVVVHGLLTAAVFPIVATGL